MRVVSGSARGIALIAPQEGTRPTSDKVKEAVFGSIQFDIMQSDVLDLFAGSGALGIEALSRGASRSVFVENAKSACEVIKKNLQKTKLEQNARLVCEDWKSGLAKVVGSFDFIFLDPPYASGVYEDVLQEIKAKNLLKNNGVIIAEHDGSFEKCEGYKLKKTKKYGQTYISYFEEDCDEGNISGQF